MMLIKNVAFVFFLSMSASCTTVLPYERIYLDDADMVLESLPEATYEINFEAYREGAAGAMGKKAGGGCGCN